MHRNVVAEIVGGLAVVIHRNGKFGVAVDILEGVARRKNTVRALAVGQFDDGIGLHKIQSDPRQAPLRLVVDETELPVVPTVLVGQVKVMSVPRKLTFEQALGEIGHPIAVGGVEIEDRDPLECAH